MWRRAVPSPLVVTTAKCDCAGLPFDQAFIVYPPSPNGKTRHGPSTRT